MSSKASDRGRHGGRIAIAHVVMSHYIGGLERMVMSLIGRLDHDRYRLVLCCIEREGDWVEEVRQYCDRIAVFEKKPGIAFGLPLRFARFFRAEHVDLVHCHNFGAYLYAASGARVACRRSIVYTMHGPDVPSDRARILLHRLPLAHRLVTVTEHMRFNAVERMHINPARVVTISNGVTIEDEGSFADGAGIRSEMRAGENTFLLGCVARLTPEKDHETLLRAFSRIAAVYDDVKLLIIGDGPLRAGLEIRARELELSDSVLFLGTRQDVAAILRALNAFVLASTEEGLPVAVLEAMSAALPIVATRIGGIPEAVSDGVTGALVPPSDDEKLADAVAGLIRDRRKAELMGAAARRRACEHFGISRMIQAYDDLYVRLSARRGG